MQKFNELDTKKSFSSFSWGKEWRYFDKDILVDKFKWSQQLKSLENFLTLEGFEAVSGVTRILKKLPNVLKSSK